MICPMNFAISIAGADECIEEECAWWKKDEEVCAVLYSAESIETIGTVIYQYGITTGLVG